MSQTKAQLIDNLVQPITGAAGSASAPTFSFTSDPNTGLYSPGADQLALATNGAGRLFVDASGRVQLGTTTEGEPTADDLTISTAADTGITIRSGTANNSNIYFSDGTSGPEEYRGIVRYSHLFDALDFWANAVHRLRITSTGQLSHIGGGTTGSPAVGFNGSAPANSLVIDSTGKVGIGTTSPNHELQVYGNSGDTVIACGDNTLTNPYIYLVAEHTTGVCQLNARSNHPLAFNVFNSEKARIDTSGRLLVGTTSASSSAPIVQAQGPGTGDSAGRIVVSRGWSGQGTATGTKWGEVLFENNGSLIAGRISCEVDAAVSAGESPGRLVFSTTADGASSPTERMRITSQGYFKASYDGNYTGTSAAYHEFHGNSANSYDLRILNDKVTPLSQYILDLRFNSSTPNDTSARFIDARDSTAQRFYVLSNGGIGNYQSNNVNLCDEREKKNIVNLDSTWDCLKHWELKKFHYNEDADDADLRYGVIAQQVAPHCPEVISDWVKQKAEDAVLDEDGNEVEPAKEEITRLAVKEQQMMWMAIKALQEAQVRIETLEAEVAALKGA